MRPPLSRAARWAMPSTPRANPLTIVIPFCQIGGQGGRNLPPIGGGATGSHHGHSPFVGWKERTLIIKNGRRVGYLLHPGWIFRMVPVYGANPGPLQGCYLVIRRGTAAGRDKLPSRPVFDSGRLQLARAGIPGIFEAAKVGFESPEPDRSQLGDTVQCHPVLYVVHITDSSTQWNRPTTEWVPALIDNRRSPMV